ncbi:hypothetical protein [Kocuria arenosa]|uniref:hypothetical protein n=1 Tax=Kocuria arenosa TaxID=3071446 RepID=UPI0034D6B568
MTAVRPGEIVTYRFFLVPNARHVPHGDRLSLTIGSSDTALDSVAAAVGFAHLEVGEASVNAILDTSALHLPLRTAK